MRLWHQEIIPVLPRSQLLAQWRELNSIYAKQDQHVLINYIYGYPSDHLYSYSQIIIKEFKKRGYTIRSFEKMHYYFEQFPAKTIEHPFPNHHTDEYFEICYFNLKEKFIRGQKDYDQASFKKLQDIYKDKKLSSD